jgi:hypothetical protein
MGAAGREIVEREYSSELIVGQTLAVYERLSNAASQAASGS